MSWEMQFKVAIIEKSPEKIIEALEALPPLESLPNKEKMEELYDYMEQSVEILEQAKQEGFNEIERLKKIKQFVKTNPYKKHQSV